MVLVLFSGLRERIDLADVPSPFRGIPIALITAGLMSLGLLMALRNAIDSRIAGRKPPPGPKTGERSLRTQSP